MNDKILFTAEPGPFIYPKYPELWRTYLPITLKEWSERSHTYPVGGEHNCDIDGCIAHNPDTPSTQFGTVGYVEQAFSKEFDIPPDEFHELYVKAVKNDKLEESNMIET